MRGVGKPPSGTRGICGGHASWPAATAVPPERLDHVWLLSAIIAAQLLRLDNRVL